MSARKNSRPLLWIVLALVALAAFGAFRPGGFLRKAQVALVRGKKVERGPLEISVVQRGNLAARDPVSVTSEIEGTSTIIFLIKEGTFVKQGDLVAKLDASALVEKKLGQEIAVQSAEAAWKKADAQYEIQKSQNNSDIEAAERKLEFAKIDLEKYKEGDYAQLVEKADNEILLAKQELTQAANTYDWSSKLNEKGFVTKTELERDELAHSRANVNLAQAERSKLLLEKYADPRSRRELQANVDEAERGLERARLKAKAQIADVEANLRSTEAKLKLEREKLQKYADQLEKSQLFAPAAGMVVYARQEGGGGRMGGDSPMQEGAQVRERQELLQIPREGGMIVEASIHESVLKQVTVGAPVSIKVDSQPGKDFFGSVAFVALLADKQSWWANPNLRVYKTEIRLERAGAGSEAALKELRPGMSCSVEIFAGRIDDCLSVPLQSIFVDKGETIVFVSQGDVPERRVVEVGRSNEKLVEIKSGLKEGDEVLLSAPPGFTPSGADESRKEGAPAGTFPGGGPAGANGAMGGGPGANPMGGARGGGREGGDAPSGMSNSPGGMPGGDGAAPAGGEGMRGRGMRGDGSGRPRGDGASRRGSRGSRPEGGERPAGDGTGAPAGESAPAGDASSGDKPAETPPSPTPGGSLPGGGQLAQPPHGDGTATDTRP